MIETRPTVQNLQASMIREVANAGMGNADISRFWFGESDRPTAGFIRDAAIRSLEAGETFYSQNLGRPYLREAIADYLSRLHDRPIVSDRIAAVGSGVSALMLAGQLVLSPGDRTVAVTPLWPNVVEIPKILGASVDRVPLIIRNSRWTLDLDRLLAALTPETRMVLINSPNNPTGWTIDDEQIEAILAHCRKRGIWVLADDVYERLVYDPALKSAPSFLAHMQPGDRVISTNSFSKSWSMTGWRLGWMVVPEPLIAGLTKLIEYNTSCILEPTQRAGEAAIRIGDAEIASLRTQLAATRAQLVDGLSVLPGIEVPDAGGAMYAFFRIAGESDSFELAKRLVREVGLGLAPGAAFGPEGREWLRWCHAASAERIDDGLERLSNFLQRGI